MDEFVSTAKVVRQIRNSNRDVLHEVGDIVAVSNWSEVLRICTVFNKDGADCQTGISIEWLERVKTTE